MSSGRLEQEVGLSRLQSSPLDLLPVASKQAGRHGGNVAKGLPHLSVASRGNGGAALAKPSLVLGPCPTGDVSAATTMVVAQVAEQKKAAPSTGHHEGDHGSCGISYVAGRATLMG
ncbi:hypothetical protein ACJRO7_030492 [Eucalyptus globulus]|uniref:Uncharacterized protein n=1 Tax=Eucalyptus globulus TaxID=34317 RepID=A0ABD3JEC9_EUCGL